ncbi:MAG: type I-E CRISPR-associated protein Cse1/CasA [Thermoguttaceae bacterium]|nr:type I-E CRISPR-associated protein Cse1/CasA [Thermoguttaceae bacterium]
MSGVKTEIGNETKPGRSFNLIDEPWIPVADSAGNEHKVGLRNLFERANEWSDLAAGTLETIAIYRLLIAIAQRALDGPKTRDDWKTAGERLVVDSLRYLEQWKDRFDLFGDKPFLQIKSLAADNRTKTDKLDFALATGNSNTLFDQCAVEEGRVHEPDWLIRKILVYQSFSPGGRIGVAQWRGKMTEGSGSSNNAPCMESNMLFTLLKGTSVFETLWWNLIPFDVLPLLPGKPIWEYEMDRITDKDCHAICRSWFGRLIPMARSIILEENGLEMILANGFAYPTLPEIREPMGSVFIRLNKNKDEWKYVRTDPNQHPWRNLHAILAHEKRDKAGSSGGAYSLENIPTIASSKKTVESYELWIGGIASNKAKIIDTASWSVQIDIGLIGDISLNNYEKGVKLAQSALGRLVRAIKTYCDHLKLEPEKDEMKSVSSLVVRAKALYWSALDRQYSVLLKVAEEEDGTLTQWRRILKNEIDSAYDKVCPHRTARQLQAFAEGKRLLYSAGYKLPNNIQNTDNTTSKAGSTKKTKAKRAKKFR